MSADERIATEVRSYYVRERHCMALYGDFAPIYEDYYLHLMQLQARPEPEQDTMLKELLAALALHLCARPQAEMSAWTLNFREPALNLFATGDSQAGTLIGRMFTQDVKTTASNLFFAQTSHPHSPPRRSTVETEGRAVLSCVEQYYRQSEQLPAKLFPQEGDTFAMLVAHPDVDMTWFEAATAELMEEKRLQEEEALRLLERREYKFYCGCNLETILKVVVSALGRDQEQIFQGADTLPVECPRCAGQFQLTPPMVERFLAEGEGS